MGYTTDFEGKFTLDPPLTLDQYQTLMDLHYNPEASDKLPGTPGGYLQWEPSKDGKSLRWDGNEKFYDYEQWLVFLNKHFFEPWGVKLSGFVSYRGEEHSDHGYLLADGTRTKKKPKATKTNDS